MKFTFTCKKVPLNDSVKDYAEKKISKLDRYFPEEAEAFVTFAVEKKNRCVVELTIRSQNGTLFRAQEEDRDGDMRGAIDEAVKLLPALRSPTILPLAAKGWCSMHSVVDTKELWTKIRQLKAIGAEGILVLNVDKIIP